LRSLEPLSLLGLPISQQDGIRHPENHKGTSCLVSTKFCQEGYCSECQIYHDYLESRLNIFPA
jgi:hypothetical protein